MTLTIKILNNSVSLASGISLTLDKLIDNKQKLLTYDNSINSLIAENQSKFINTKEECLLLTLLDNRKIICKPNQKFLTDENKWIQAKDIKIDTLLKSGINYPNCDDIFMTTNYILDFENFKFNLNNINQIIRALSYVRILAYMSTDSSSNKQLYPGNKIDSESIVLDIEILTGKSISLIRNTKILKRTLPDELIKSLNAHHNIFPDFLFDPKCPIFIIREFIASFFGGDGVIPYLTQNKFDNISLQLVRDGKNIDKTIDNLKKLSSLMLSRFNIESIIEKELHLKKDGDNSIYYINLIINYDHSLQFAEQIGFRYCCHKSYRLLALSSYLKYKKSIIDQNTFITNRSKELVDKYNRQNPKTEILQINKNTNEIIKIYESAIKAEAATQINRSQISTASKKNSITGGFKWKLICKEKENLDEPGCKSLPEAREKAIEELKINDGIINENHIVSISQVRRCVVENIMYKNPTISIREYLNDSDLLQFCLKDNKYNHYSINYEKNLPCYNIPVIFKKNIGIREIIEINTENNNFLIEGVVSRF